MVRLVHLSDVHLGPLPPVSFADLASKRVTGYVNWRRNRAHRMMDDCLDALIDDMLKQRPDHIAVTGDLVNLALDAEIDTARMWLDAIGDPPTVSVVPGNHDAYVPGALDKVKGAWAPFMYGDDHHGEGHATFPYLRRRGNLALIGLSSAEATIPFTAHGYFRGEQARAAGALLEQARSEGLTRIVMIHHPPVHRATPIHKRLYGITRFQKLIAEQGADLVLHGHTHLPTLNWIAGRDGRVPIVGVSAASEGLGGHRPPASYNLLEIAAAQGNRATVTLERRGLTGATAHIDTLERLDLTTLRDEAG